jgi:hypothetical protein
MSFDTQRKDSVQIIRLVSDMLIESDKNSFKTTVQTAINDGIKQFIFSVSIGSVSNQVTIYHLLLWCSETIRNNNGQLFFIENDDGGYCVFSRICELLNIPLFRNCDTASITMHAPVAC